MIPTGQTIRKFCAPPIKPPSPLAFPRKMDQLTRATVYPRLSLDGFVRRIEEAHEDITIVRKKLKQEKFEHNATKHEMMWVFTLVLFPALFLLMSRSAT